MKCKKQVNPTEKKSKSQYSPGHTLRVPEGWGSQISRQSAHEGGKVVSPMHRPPSPARKYSSYSFLLEVESTPGSLVRPEGLCQWKIPMTPSGIEPATFWFVAQCLNQLRHHVPPIYTSSGNILRQHTVWSNPLPRLEPLHRTYCDLPHLVQHLKLTLRRLMSYI